MRELSLTWQHRGDWHALQDCPPRTCHTIQMKVITTNSGTRMPNDQAM